VHKLVIGSVLDIHYEQCRGVWPSCIYRRSVQGVAEHQVQLCGLWVYLPFY